jgi:arylsulfatase A-like enzyme
MRYILAILLSLAASTCSAAPKLNVLFIAVDDLRPELNCYGVEQIRSPNIDRLASRGLLFERAYCQVSVCNPSRNSLLSGCRPDTTGIFANNKFLRPSMPDIVTLPQHFKQHGWHSYSIGKVFHHSEREPGDDPQSWSEPAWYHGTPYRSWLAPESEEFIKKLKKLPKKQQPKLFRGPPYEAADAAEDLYPDGQTAAKAIETLQRLKDEPFFLGVGFVKPHLPFNCPRKYWDLYPAESVKVPAPRPPRDVPEPALHDWYELRTYGGIPATGGIDEATQLALNRGYRACVTFVDGQIGRVLDELDRLGLRERTIVVLWGDHGYHLGENGIYTKMTNFELATRVPLVVSAPGQTSAGKRTQAIVELVDLYPTLAELCGLPLPEHLEGTSFAPVLADPSRAWKPAAFSQYLRRGKEGIMGRSIRTDRWRYTEWVDPQQQPAGSELYDHQSDPAEMVNIVGDPANQSVVYDLARRLHAGWRASVPSR